jgi:hypothetical protein
MYIVAQHPIKDPARFWSVSPQGPGAPRLQAAYPSHDKTKGVCLWESDSIDALRDSLDSLVGDAAATPTSKSTPDSRSAFPSARRRASS